MKSIEQEAATENLYEQVCQKLLRAMRTETPRTWQSPTHLFVRISCPYTDFTPLELLELLPSPHKTYWRDRNGMTETCGIGIAHSFEATASDTSSTVVRSVHDATRLAPRQSMLRISTGRDAADTAFLTNHWADLWLSNMEVLAIVDELPIDDGTELVQLG